jgi:hypothetical protein
MWNANGRTTDAYPWQKFTWPMARWTKNNYLTSRSKFKVPQRLVRAITFLSFKIGQWYLVCGCMTIRRCVALRGDISFRYWGQRSMPHEGHYGTRHTTLWSCTHIPNIIDLSGKTKKLWSVQASLRRSGRRRSRRSGVCGCMTIRRCVALRGDISFRYLKLFFLVFIWFYFYFYLKQRFKHKVLRQVCL